MKNEAVYEAFYKVSTILFYAMVGLMAGGVLMAAFAAYVSSLVMMALAIVVLVVNEKINRIWFEMIREGNKEKR